LTSDVKVYFFLISVNFPYSKRMLRVSSNLKRTLLQEKKYGGVRLVRFSKSTRSLSDASRTSTTIVTKYDDQNDVPENELRKEKVRGSANKTSAYLELAKAKLSALVVTTTAAGFVAAGGPLSDQASLAGCCILGTALCSSSAAAWNQIYERDRDAKMKRTQQRPLIIDSLTVKEASVAATLWGVSGTSILALGTDPITASLGLANIGLYAGLYTWMKPRSIYNTWVGAVVGAIPPVMGWTAATGGAILDLDAIVLGTTLYLWQMPHFFALSYMYRVDYERGGFVMLPVLESDGERTSKIILRYAGYLSTVPIITTLCDVTSSMFAFEGIALNSYALYIAYKFRHERTNANARKVFLTSLWYLPCWLVLFLLHSKVWDEEKDRDILRDKLSDAIHYVRDQGRQACLHEHAIAKSASPLGEEACPVTLSKKTSKIVTSATSTVKERAVETVGVNREI
jgi:protoheme IX farnesyltransferase